MAGSPFHATLVANVVTTLTFDYDAGEVEVLNVDGAAAVYVRTDGVAPTVRGTGCDVLPAAIGVVSLKVRTDGPTVVKLISAGSPEVSVKLL